MANDLNPRQEEFARLYYAGPDEVRGNATRAYMEAYPDSSYEAAKSNAHRLLTHDGVRARMRALREEAAEEAKARAREWWELYPDAQETLQAAAQGNVPGETPQDKRSAVEAAKEIVARCLGSVKLQHEHSLDGQAIIAHVVGTPKETSDRRDDSEASDNGRELPSPGPTIKPVED